jgi:hypothetical protein
VIRVHETVGSPLEICSDLVNIGTKGSGSSFQDFLFLRKETTRTVDTVTCRSTVDAWTIFV